MTAIDANMPGYCYILCFDRPIGNSENPRALAGHYLGWALDVHARIAMHAAGRGAALTQAVVAAGVGWQAFYRPGTPGLERWFKGQYKDTPRLCPRCAHARQRAPRYGFQPLSQLVLPLLVSDAAFDFPAPPTRGMDWMEISQLRRWRAARAAFIPVGDLAALDACV